MRIDLVSLSSLKPSRYGFTGETPIFELSKSLKRRGHEINIFCLRDEREEITDLEGVKIHRSIPWYYHSISESGFKINLKAFYVGLRYIPNVMDSDADIFQILNNPIPFIAKKILSRKTFIYNLFALYTLMLDEFSKYNTEAFYSRPSIFFERESEKLAFKNANHIIANSPTMKKKIIAGWNIPSEKIDIIYSGVNTDLFKPIKKNKDDFKIVYEGSITPFRGIENLLEAFKLVKKKIKDAKLLIVGGSYRTYLGELTYKIHRLGLCEDVEVTGYVPYKEVPNYLATASVGISTLPPLETFKFSSPLKIFEYLSMRLPIVATKEIPIHRHIIQEGKCGILTSYNAVNIAKAIISIHKDDKSEEMGFNGRKLVESNYTWDHVAEKFENIYRKVLG